MAFSTKITFVPRDNGEKSISFDNVDYGITGCYSVFDTVESKFKFLNFRTINSDGYYDFVSILSYDEFMEFHKNYRKTEEDFIGKELSNFLTKEKLRYNWVIIELYEWETGMDF